MTKYPGETPQQTLVRLLARVRWTKAALADATGFHRRTIHKWLEYQTPLEIPGHVIQALGFLAQVMDMVDQQLANRPPKGKSKALTSYSADDPGFVKAATELARRKSQEDVVVPPAPPPFPAPLQPPFVSAGQPYVRSPEEEAAVRAVKANNLAYEARRKAENKES